MLDYGCALVAQ